MAVQLFSMNQFTFTTNMQFIPQRVVPPLSAYPTTGLITVIHLQSGITNSCVEDAKRSSGPDPG